MASPDELYIGLMSGTSLDGIDAVLVDLSASTPRLLAAATYPFAAGLRDELLALCSSGDDEIDRLGRSDRRLGAALADAVNQLLKTTNIAPSAVRAIGSHGQTVRHRPSGPYGFTLQIGDPATLAERTGITVVADFRRRDIAAGGQGAPLVPAFHEAVFASDASRVIVNIGGIANITLVHPTQPLLGFDTGPGNVLLDAWIDEHRGLAYDRDGEWAAQGHVLPALLTAFRQEPYLSQAPPKSTGRELFNLEWLRTRLPGDTALDPADIQATLAELTALSIAEAIGALPVAVDEVFVCGGGAYNEQLMRRLQLHLGRIPVATTDVLGMAPAWVEGIAFAWLAQRTLRGMPGNAPAVTGAARSCILGAIHPC